MNGLHTHVSIDTPELSSSIEFYRALFGAEPAVSKHDYARFELSEPPLVLGLNALPEGASGDRGAIDHLGLRFAGEAHFKEAAERLSAAGLGEFELGATDCCYSSLERSWVSDPSGVRWELFLVVESEIEAENRAAGTRDCCESTCCNALES